MPGKQRAAPCLAPKNMVAADGPRGLPGKWWVQRDFSLFFLLMSLSLFSGQQGWAYKKLGKVLEGKREHTAFCLLLCTPGRHSVTVPRGTKQEATTYLCVYLFTCLPPLQLPKKMKPVSYP